MFSLEGKKAIVTGGGRGLGRGMVEGLLEAGAQVAVLDILNVEDTELSGDVEYFQVDLENRSERNRAFYGTLRKMDGLDILVNNAGKQYRSPAEHFPMEEWDGLLELNLTCAMDLSQKAGRYMLEKGEGVVINVASMLSFTGGYTVVAYAASKGGIAQLTKTLANEWAGRGVRVNAIAHGFMETALNYGIEEERREKITERIPVGRWGEPEDLKGPVVFLASDAAKYIHGVILPVDGGYLVR